MKVVIIITIKDIRPWDELFFLEILKNQVIEPYFFEETPAGAWYLQFLQGNLLPQLNQLFHGRMIFAYSRMGRSYTLPLMSKPLQIFFSGVSGLGEEFRSNGPPKVSGFDSVIVFLWKYLKDKVFKIDQIIKKSWENASEWKLPK